MLRIRSVFTGVAGTPWYSNIYFNAALEDAQLCVNNVAALWNDYSLAQLRTGVNVITEAQVPQIDPASGDITALTTVTQPPGANGTQSVEALPPQTQFCASLRTGSYVGGREIRGKIYFPGLTIDHSDPNGAPTSALRGNIEANVTFNLISSALPECVVWSRKNGVMRSVTGVTTPTRFSVLRSRRD